MTKEWLDLIWETQGKVDEKRLSNLVVPPFLNLQIAITQLPEEKKAHVEQLILNNGGVSVNEYQM